KRAFFYLYPLCNKICGNILLHNDITNLTVWKEEISRKVTITISIFNNTVSTSMIKVNIIRNIGNSIETFIPPGNTLSVTTDDVKLITISQEGINI
ncbi:S-Ena type endospore appendage, partial [Xenorhabdus cabanillasii]|uniref:S-Ena type endospore appendage n=2 Tax=Xenorhabdus TaxID=626 RepID=UPI002B40AEFE